MTNQPKPPADYILEQFAALRPIAKVIGLFSKNVRESFNELELQARNVERIMHNKDIFRSTYAPLGWVFFDRVSVNVIDEAVSLTPQEGEELLTSYHLEPENLRFFGHRLKTSHYSHWLEIYDRAVERSIAEDYLSAVPLILSIVDGICTTTTGKHPFSGGADAPVFDSQTSGPGGLSDALALLGATKRKLDSQPLSIPFRHAIVHGLNTNYGNRIVAAKSFNILHAMIDYFDRKRDEVERIAKAESDQRQPEWREIARSLQRNAQARRALDNWQARPSINELTTSSSEFLATLEPGTPEYIFVEYLDLIRSRNFGKLARVTVDFPLRSIGYRAGRIRDDLTDIYLTNWTITRIEDISPAMTLVSTSIEGRFVNKEWNGKLTARLMFGDENFEPMMRNQEGGRWTVMPDFITGIRLLALNSA